MGKRNKGKHFCNFTDFPTEALILPFSADSLTQVLKDAASDNSFYTHQQISNWAWRFWWECNEGSLVRTTENDPTLAAAAEIALGIDAQWDMFLVNTYSMEQLQTMDFTKIELPREWFKEWLTKLD